MYLFSLQYDFADYPMIYAANNMLDVVTNYFRLIKGMKEETNIEKIVVKKLPETEEIDFIDESGSLIKTTAKELLVKVKGNEAVCLLCDAHYC
mgnify:CR=1 FL=1